MPRAGLTGDDVVAAAAGLADELGFQAVTMGVLADRLGVPRRPCTSTWAAWPTCSTGVATLAMTEFGDVIRDAAQGRAGLDALAAALTAARAYVTAHRAGTGHDRRRVHRAR